MITSLTVLGGLLAAGLGAWVADLLRRARPQLIPTSIRRTVDVIPDGSVVEPNAELLATCSEHPYLESPPFEGIGKVEEQEYIDYLTRTQARVEDYVRVQLPAVAERALQFQAKLAADDFDGAGHIWTHADRLWVTAEGAYVRGEFSLNPASPNSDPNDDDGEVADLIDDCDIATSPDGTIVVLYPGFVLPLIFKPEPRPGRSGERSRELAERLALSFAKRQKPDLIRVFNFLAGIERSVPRLEAINQRITDELRRLTRLTVTALIGNAGGNPVSISKQTCKVNLLLDGYTYDIDSDDSGKPRQQRGDIELELMLVDKEGYPIPPLAVEGGGVQPITAVYRRPLSSEKLPEGGSLYELLDAALKGAERGWQLEVDTVLRRNAAKSIRSKKISFRDIHSSDRRSPSRPDTDDQISIFESWINTLRSEIASLRGEGEATRSGLDQLTAQLTSSTIGEGASLGASYDEDGSDDSAVSTQEDHIPETQQ